MRKKFVFYKQNDSMDCGPACLRMVAKYFGKHFSLETLRQKSQFNSEGVSLLGISEAAESIGFRTIGAKVTYKEVTQKINFPAIIHWGQNHFVVVISYRSGFKENITIADPKVGIVKIDKKTFCNRFYSDRINDEDVGVVLRLEPTTTFFNQDEEKPLKVGWGLLLKYLFRHKVYIYQIFLALGFGSLLQLIFPFLAQSIVDIGIATRNLSFIYVILIAQFMLLFSRIFVEFIRSRILLFISTNINLSILSDFWIKLMKLPINYFGTKTTGDLLQRINDHKRIESFLTGPTLSVVFSVVNLILFSLVLYFYSQLIFFIILLSSIFYFIWIKVFLKYRRDLDYKRFAIASKENSTTLQLIQGMQEIKLNNAEQLRRWEWENLQAQLFKLSFRSLSLNQIQQAGSFVINEGKNIIITFIVAKEVVEGQLTLGAMLAVQYIIGQLTSPIEQMLGFVQQAQDAKISLDRLNEIHQIEEEESSSNPLIQRLPSNKSITISNLSFFYPGAGNENVLNDVSFLIPEGKVTAIVGISGSGKTTILKLLLKIFESYNGAVDVGKIRLKDISARFWRKHCGVVMQDGFIFNDTISANIAVGVEYPDYDTLIQACKIANILSFIEELPLGLNTKLGSQGTGISAGQKQRILIARAVYKDPQYLFFDEATNALDSDNELVIMENLGNYFKGRTVIIVAHRLSTVRNADNIIVLRKGTITEQGTHTELTDKRGEYFNLVKNQLELGN